jgi:hypothetical protein
MREKTDRLGAILALAIYTLYILMFLFRLLGQAEFGRLLASIQFLAVLPLAYLLWRAPQLERPPLYYIQVVLMLAFLFVELSIDYVFQIDFRQVSWMVIAYVTFFFAACGGMLGLAANSGRGWTIAAVSLFLAMAVLAFVQRAVTGM